MTLPDWLKPGIYGAIVGAVAISIIGFSWGGWVTGASADEMARTMAEDEVVAALVPVCLGLSERDPARASKMVAIKAASSYSRYKAVMDAGWATAPGEDSPDRALATACMPGLNIDAS